MRWLLAILLALCSEKGQPIYKETRAPISGATAGLEEIVVYRSGAWRGPTDAGCLTRKRLAEVKRALKKAKFARKDGSVCDAVPIVAITYSSGKRSVSTERPCGLPIDRGTERAAACVTAAIDASVSLAQLRAVCRH